VQKSVVAQFPVSPLTVRNRRAIGRSIGHHQIGKRGVTGNVDPRLRFEWISFLKGYLCGQTDTAKQDLEARIRTQSIKQQVRLEGQGKA
jgi:hypothetical protein